MGTVCVCVQQGRQKDKLRKGGTRRRAVAAAPAAAARTAGSDERVGQQVQAYRALQVLLAQRLEALGSLWCESQGSWRSQLGQLALARLLHIPAATRVLPAQTRQRKASMVARENGGQK